MPAPSAEVFDRLRNLAAIQDATERPTSTIDEVFTGKPLTTIPIGTAADVEAAFAKARAAQPGGRSVRSPNGPRSSAVTAIW